MHTLPVLRSITNHTAGMAALANADCPISRAVSPGFFCDGDGSDDFDDVDLMIKKAERGADLILTNPFATKSGREAMTFVQRFGNQLIRRLIQLGWKFRFTDFGPLRLIRRESLDDIAMRER